MTRSSTAFAFVAAACLFTTGCSGSKSAVTLKGDQPRQLFAQSFDRAYISSSQDGEYDIVLIQDDAEKQSRPKTKLTLNSFNPFVAEQGPPPLQPLSSQDFRQVVHLHVFWQASGGSVAKDGVVTNAAIDWYVFAPSTGGAAGAPAAGPGASDLIRYEGAGYVLLSEGEKAATVEIRDGAMRKTESKGSMRDPIGPSKLTGRITARRDSKLVENLLADLKAQVATPERAPVSIAR